MKTSLSLAMLSECILFLLIGQGSRPITFHWLDEFANPKLAYLTTDNSVLWINKTRATIHALNFNDWVIIHQVRLVMVAKKQINISTEFKFWDIELEDSLKNEETCHVPSLGLDLSIF
jgi:hypothetical protein